MSVTTQGTQIYILDPEASGGPEILTIACATSLDGFGAPREQIEDTCLESSSRTYQPGLKTPGTATVTINADPSNASHVRLHELYTAGTKFDFAIGWGDGTAAPTIDTAGELEFPTSRTYLTGEDAYVSDFPFNFSLNAIVTSGVTLQLSGDLTLFPKA